MCCLRPSSDMRVRYARGSLCNLYHRPADIRIGVSKWKDSRQDD